MRFRIHPLLYELRYPFRLATGSRTHTNAVLTEMEWQGFRGFGEAAMPPYYGENHETASGFLRSLSDSGILSAGLKDWSETAPIRELIEDTMAQVDALTPGNHAAKASVDIALHDLWGQVVKKPLWELLAVSPGEMPPTSFTLGMDRPEILQKKFAEAGDFQIIKVKLGAEDDRDIIRAVRKMTDKPIYADANQGWKDREAALDLTHWLAEQGVRLIEQPFHKDDLASAAWLSARSPLPVFADESFQRVADLDRVADHFHGVNIKLMKCTGLSEGFRALGAARLRGLQCMVGCMTESSCGIYAAALLAPLCDFADTDGCWLIQNNPFEMPVLTGGRVQLSPKPGLGLTPKAIFL